MGRRRWMLASLLTLLLLVLLIGVGKAENRLEPFEGAQPYWFFLPDSGWNESDDSSVIMKFDTRMVTNYQHHTDVPMKKFELSGQGKKPEGKSYTEGDYPAWL